MSMLYAVLLIHHTILSLATFSAYGLDKRAARRPGVRRTPERTLHILALLGGWPGGLLAQRAFRHKRSKPRFMRVFWLTVALHMFALAGLWIAVM